MNDGTNNGKPMDNLRLAPRQKPAELNAAGSSSHSPLRAPVSRPALRPHLEDVFAAPPPKPAYQSPVKPRHLSAAPIAAPRADKAPLATSELRQVIEAQRPAQPAPVTKQVRTPIPVAAPVHQRKPVANTSPVRAALPAQATQAVAKPANDQHIATAKLNENFGAFIQVLAETQRYRHIGLGETTAMFLAPLQRERVAIALSGASEQEARVGKPTAFMIWASVSPQVDETIRDQVAAGVFPVRLKPEDWNSGTINWLLDVIAPTAQLRSTAMSSFVQSMKLGELRLHPIINRLVEAEHLAKLGVVPRPEAPRKTA